MKNVEMKLDGDILTIKVDVTKEFGPSASGKTIIIASTEGNISIPEKDAIKIGLNVYKKKPVAA
jgi:ABC-type molybdate transport system ATPase subunit